MAQDSFSKTTILLRSQVNQLAYKGLVIAVVAVGIASAATGYMATGELSLNSMYQAQMTNATLWILDAMPLFFLFWGQYAGALMSIEASAMVMDETKSLRVQNESLEYQLAHDTTHDRLTDLPNRLLFLDRVFQAIKAARRERYELALIAVNIDSFKSVNEALGHFNGDMLLKQLANRLKGSLRSPDTVARMGGDEFAVLVPKIRSRDDIKAITDKFVEALKAPFMLAGVEIEMLASIGVSIYPEHSTDAEGLIQKMDTALYTAKRQDGFSVMVYSPEQDASSPERLSLLGELRRSIEGGDILVYFQPKVDVNRKQIAAVEALVRWNHPQRGILSPGLFVPLAERTGLIKPLTLFVMEASLRQCAAWNEQNLKIKVAINVSAKVLLDPDFPDLVVEALDRYQLERSQLIVEITESSIMEDQVRALETVTQLSDQGIHISIDDFGTGYSSLAYLSQLPVDEIKIDQSFVMSMLNKESDAVIVKATVGLAHSLGLVVIAEGVESKEVWNRLADMQCDQIQGYYVSRPVPGPELTKLLIDSPWALR